MNKYSYRGLKEEGKSKAEISDMFLSFKSEVGRELNKLEGKEQGIVLKIQSQKGYKNCFFERECFYVKLNGNRTCLGTQLMSRLCAYMQSEIAWHSDGQGVMWFNVNSNEYKLSIVDSDTYDSEVKNAMRYSCCYNDIIIEETVNAIDCYRMGDCSSRYIEELLDEGKIDEDMEDEVLFDIVYIKILEDIQLSSKAL